VKAHFDPASTVVGHRAVSRMPFTGQVPVAVDPAFGKLTALFPEPNQENHWHAATGDFSTTHLQPATDQGDAGGL